ncbi:MAG: hypothetical protein AAFY88_28025, partial [Acidobacteriota bacterium]
VRTYSRDGEDLPAPEEVAARARVMDCVDCHNRPSHLLEVPSEALDEVLVARPDLRGLPFYKRQSLAAFDVDYGTRDVGVAAVRQALLTFYRGDHPALWAESPDLVQEGAEEAARVYGRSFFPEWKTDWRSQPDHLGHENFPGCFRCHDEELATSDGQHVISIDCELCHYFPIESSPEPPELTTLRSSTFEQALRR